MKKIVLALILLVMGAMTVQAADTLKTPYPPNWYTEHYPFSQFKGSAWTFESEFLWPEGFRRLDEKQLTPYQFWVSNFPLLHYAEGVGSLARGTVLPADKISRTTNFPWRTPKFYDCVIPLQMLAEYLLYLKKPDKLAFTSKVGESLSYETFLKSDVSYDAHGRAVFTPIKKREASDSLFSLYLDMVALNTSYASLEANCDSISDSLVMPGDLLIGRDSLGVTGQVYIVLLVVANKAGEKRYIAGRGCDDGCDLFIPLFHGDRSNPWLTMAELKGLVVRPHVGFYRLIVPTEKHKK